MKVAIVGDVHLTLRKYKEFEEKRFKLLIDELIKSKPSKIIFAGDLLDNARPSLEELQLVYYALSKIEAEGIKVVIISGNHEALSIDTCTYDLIMNNGKNYINDKYLSGTNIRCVGWTSVKTTKHKNTQDILVTHLRANHGLLKEEFNIKLLSDNYKLVFMGDLHFRYSPYNNVHYTSSPYSTKFTNSNLEDYGYIMLEDDTCEWEYISLNLPCKVKVKCNFSDVTGLIKSFKNHLLKLEVSGTIEELESLPTEDNVIYNKVVQESLNTIITNNSNTDVIDTLLVHIKESDFMSKYPNTSTKIDNKIKELKGA